MQNVLYTLTSLSSLQLLWLTRATTTVQGLPLHHGIFQQNAIFINLRAVAVEYDQVERDSFLKEDLGLKSEDVRDIFVDPSTLLLHLTLATPALFALVLDRLFAGVPWTAVNGNPVFGWAAAEPLVTIRVTGVLRGFPAADMRQQLECFGPISQFYRTPDRIWSSASNGVFIISLQCCKVLPRFSDPPVKKQIYFFKKFWVS